MKTINGILVLEKEHDYKENDIIWEGEDSIRLSIGVIHHNNNHVFPQFYKYCAPWDSHCCGDYYPMDKDEAFTKINNYLNNEIRALKNLKKQFEEKV